MNELEQNEVEKTLQKPDIHKRWESSYRTAENERFYEEAFDYITKVLNAPKKSTFLDAGCGSCAHSIRLAKRGYFVVAIDCSESILETAEQNIKKITLAENIKLKTENITSLSFPDRTFDYILCWGVLMHIPDIENGISELDRVLKKGGYLVISEGNMFSFQSILVRNLRLFFRHKKLTVKRTIAGNETNEITSAGKLFVRNANIRWLKDTFRSRGFNIKRHVSGQFFELYILFSSQLLKKLIHGFNCLWFKHIKIPYFSHGNIIILQKQI